MGMEPLIPALLVRDVRASVAHYREQFGFDAPHETDDFAVLVRDDAALHLLGRDDEGWRSRHNLDERPISSGAESFLAGTASCRIEVADVDALSASWNAKVCSTTSPAAAWMHCPRSATERSGRARSLASRFRHTQPAAQRVTAAR
jgi:catechol 2,3-dioxygenase-like lactoylglutathione lyase family enzyme